MNGTDHRNLRRPSNGHLSPAQEEKMARLVAPITDESRQKEFNDLIFAYGEHQQMMRLSFRSGKQFLDEIDQGELELRAMKPDDIQKLSEVELAGLLFWLTKNHPYKALPKEDREYLLTRYSVRKLSLDHFYSASKHPEHVRRREFVMNNNTFVPDNRTGFELDTDDDVQIIAKREIFNTTFSRFWTKIIEPFIQIGITETEIVFLHCMLLWSENNDSHVTEATREVSKYRREWITEYLIKSYNPVSVNPFDRHAKILELLGEVETVCEMHCQDFQVAKLFEFADMSKFWYETLCYAPCNTVEITPYLALTKKMFGDATKQGKGYWSEEENDPFAGLSPNISLLNHLKGPIELRDGYHNENGYLAALRADVKSPDPNDPMNPANMVNMANVDRRLLAVNTALLPNIMQPLPDDQPYDTSIFNPYNQQQ